MYTDWGHRQFKSNPIVKQEKAGLWPAFQACNVNGYQGTGVTRSQV
jgi:hypothetical protein